MQRYEIEIEVTPEGEIKATVKGVKGKQCGPLSQFLDELGIVTHDGDTPEAFQQENVTIINRLTTRRS